MTACEPKAVCLRTGNHAPFYVIGDGPTSTVYDDAMHLIEVGQVEMARCALRSIFYRHLDTADALARATSTDPPEMPYPTSLGTPDNRSDGLGLGFPVRETVRRREERITA